MSVTLQAASCQCDDDHRTPEQRQVRQSIFFTESALETWPLPRRGGRSTRGTRTTGGRLGENTNSVQPFQPTDLLGGVQSVHDGQLDIHQHQVKPTLPPFAHRLFAVGCALPAHTQSLHKRFQKLLIDDVIFNDEDVDGRNGAVNQSSEDCTWR